MNDIDTQIANLEAQLVPLRKAKAEQVLTAKQTAQAELNTLVANITASVAQAYTLAKEHYLPFDVIARNSSGWGTTKIALTFDGYDWVTDDGWDSSSANC